MLWCEECNAEIVVEEFPFGEDVRCICGSVYETDWDSDYDSYYCWVTRKKQDGAKKDVPV